MRLFIVEPLISAGHHPIYVSLISKEARRRGWDAHILTARATDMESEGVRSVLDAGVPVHSIVDNVSFSEGAGTVAGLQYQFQQHTAFGKAVRELAAHNKPDFVYLTNLDYMHRVAAFRGSPFGPYPFAGVLAGIRFHHQSMGVIAPPVQGSSAHKLFFRGLLRLPTLRAVLTPDDLIQPYLEQCGFPNRGKVAYIPEMANFSSTCDKERARKQLGLNSDRVVLLCYGALSRRKGVEVLMRLLNDERCPSALTVLFAGRQEEAVRQILHAHGVERLRNEGRVIALDRFLDGNDEAIAFAASDLAWLGYTGYYGISGVTMQAAVSGLPVLACKEGIIGWWVRKYGIGECVDVDSVDSVLGAVYRLISDPQLRTQYAQHGLSLGPKHAGTAFASAICDAIDGQPSAALAA